MHTLKITNHRANYKNHIHSGMLIHKIRRNTELLNLDIGKGRQGKTISREILAVNLFWLDASGIKYNTKFSSVYPGTVPRFHQL